MDFQEHVGGSPGRSGHSQAIRAARIVFSAREAVARLFNVTDPLRIIFTKNATEAINLVLYGLLRPGDHVITSQMEHNSVMRPLRYLASKGVALSVMPSPPEGELDPSAISSALRPNTRLVVLTHASNVTGAIMPVAKIGGLLAAYPKVRYLVDAAQTAGSIPIDVEEMKVDFLTFSGHKSLFGPQGTGGLYIREGREGEVTPLLRGGTGSHSEWEEQPAFMPDKFEAGTPNTVGLAGLGAGVSFVLDAGIDAIRRKKERLTAAFLSGLEAMEGRVTLYGPRQVAERIAVISFNLDGLSPAEVAEAMDERWGVLSRPGLHCAPAAHRAMGTFPTGTVRFSFGYFNREEEIALALKGLMTLLEERHGK